MQSRRVEVDGEWRVDLLGDVDGDWIGEAGLEQIVDALSRVGAPAKRSARRSLTAGRLIGTTVGLPGVDGRLHATQLRRARERG